MPTTPIHDLVDFPAIQQIQAALWGTGEILGAAVMVGSGYSRNALLPADTSPRPPLWSDFCKAMSEKLYPGGGAPKDPLRLAEEFKAILGATALESLICDLVRDKEWSPGHLHRDSGKSTVVRHTHYQLGHAPRTSSREGSDSANLSRRQSNRRHCSHTRP